MEKECCLIKSWRTPWLGLQAGWVLSVSLLHVTVTLWAALKSGLGSGLPLLALEQPTISRWDGGDTTRSFDCAVSPPATALTVHPEWWVGKRSVSEIWIS